MRFVGIDYGQRNIGLAISDELGITVRTLGKYRRKNSEQDAKYFQELIKEHNIDQIVVGLPIRMDGTMGAKAQEVKEFGRWLQEITHLTVIFWDERWSTKEALNILRNRQVKYKEGKEYKDQISAAIILSNYLESQREK